jgi:hypothetical protein
VIHVTTAGSAPSAVVEGGSEPPGDLNAVAVSAGFGAIAAAIGTGYVPEWACGVAVVLASVVVVLLVVAGRVGRGP